MNAVRNSSALIGFSPQGLIWQMSYGSFFYFPNSFNLSLRYFDLSSIFLSPFHGILIWTPVMIISLTGLVIAAYRMPVRYLGLLIVFLLQLLINSCCLAFWEGHSFGLRQMTSLFPVIAIGIVCFIELFTASVKLRMFAWVSVVLCSLWTFGLLVGSVSGLNLGNYVSLPAIIEYQRTVPKHFMTYIVSLLSINRPGLSLYLQISVFMLVFSILFFLSVAFSPLHN